MKRSQIPSETIAQRPPTHSELRLRKHSDYQRAYAAAHKQHTREMSYFFALRDRLPERRLHPDQTPVTGPRIGLTVPKALGKAHDRNRIKRRMRAAVALHVTILADLKVDVILHPRRSVLTLDWIRLHGEVLQVFRSIRKQCTARIAEPTSTEKTGAPSNAALEQG